MHEFSGSDLANLGYLSNNGPKENWHTTCLAEIFSFCPAHRSVQLLRLVVSFAPAIHSLYSLITIKNRFDGINFG